MPGEAANLAEFFPEALHGGAKYRNSDIEFDPQRRYVLVEEDFLLDAGATLPLPWGKQDTGGGAANYEADAAGGVYHLALEATDEVQTLTLYFADQLVIGASKKPIITFGIKIPQQTAVTRFVAGLASARNATLDSIVTNAWIRAEGANNNILIETDDGTTDTDDKDSGADYTAGGLAHFRIDLTNLSDVGFYRYNTTSRQWERLNNGNTMSLAAASAAVLQPYFELQKDSGSSELDVSIAYVHVSVDR